MVELDKKMVERKNKYGWEMVLMCPKCHGATAEEIYRRKVTVTFANWMKITNRTVRDW